MLPRSGSIKWRLQAWHGVLLALVTTTLLVAYHRSQRAEAVARLDREHRQILLVVLPELRPSGPVQSRLRAGDPAEPPPLRPGPAEEASDDPRGQLLEDFVTSGGFVLHRPPGRPVRAAFGTAPAEVLDALAALDPRADDHFADIGAHRVLWHLRRGGEVIALGSPLAPLDAKLAALGRRLAGAGALVVLLGVVAGAWIISRTLRPLETIAATARRIADGALSERIPAPPGEGEISRLAQVLNDCFARVERAFRQQARFTADASHELRTPISVILTESQLALKRERAGDDYRESLAVCRDTAARMKQLVDDLLILARADAQALQSTRAPQDLAVLATRTRDFVAALAEERGVTLRLAAAAAPCLGDAAQLERVLVNLTMNALQHAPAGTVVTLETTLENTADAREAVARVTDHGPGIPAEALAHLFERFHRTDDSRARATGGTGLGLAISRGIAEAHGGRLGVESEPGVRTVFTLRIPTGPS